jgi:hypothetical protein
LDRDWTGHGFVFNKEVILYYGYAYVKIPQSFNSADFYKLFNYNRPARFATENTVLRKGFKGKNYTIGEERDNDTRQQ